MSGFGDGLRVLVVDDDPAVCSVLRLLLGDEGFRVDTFDTIGGARAAIDAGDFDLVLLDHNLPDGTGLDLVHLIAQRGLDCEMVMMTADARVDTVVRAMQHGARDFIIKPWENVEAMKLRLNRVVDALHLKRQNRSLIAQLRDRNRELEAMAVRDPLTRLFNHAFFQESLEREVQRARRHGHEIGLLFIDLDRFKEVNDRYGHPTGDRLLRTFADILMGAASRDEMTFRLRAQDITARYGGDEFAIILPETPKDGAVFKAEALRAFVEQFNFAGLELPQQTVSVGVATFARDARDRAGLVETADQALYEAKRAGRNRIQAARTGGTLRQTS